MTTEVDAHYDEATYNDVTQFAALTRCAALLTRAGPWSTRALAVRAPLTTPPLPRHDAPLRRASFPYSRSFRGVGNNPYQLKMLPPVMNLPIGQQFCFQVLSKPGGGCATQVPGTYPQLCCSALQATLHKLELETREWPRCTARRSRTAQQPCTTRPFAQTCVVAQAPRARVPSPHSPSAKRSAPSS